MSRLVAVAPALPDHVYRQDAIADALGPLLTGDPDRLALHRRLHEASGISTRHLARTLDSYAALGGFDAANGAFLALGTELAARALGDALDQAGLAAADLDHLMVTTVTGVGAPSIDALLVDRLGLRPDLRRVPSFGLGCAGGAAGLARVDDYLLGHPDHVAALVCVELCSLTLQAGDDSTRNLVGSALFGDGAAAAVLVGSAHPAADEAPAVLDSLSALIPGTSDLLGWDVGAHGFRVVLGAGLPQVIEANLAAPVQELLGRHGLGTRDVGLWLVHAGGPKILDAVERALDLDPQALWASRASLDLVGNLSSASVLHVLHTTTTGQRPAPGTVGLLMAFGPGVACELVLLRWPPR